MGTGLSDITQNVIGTVDRAGADLEHAVWTGRRKGLHLLRRHCPQTAFKYLFTPRESPWGCHLARLALCSCWQWLRCYPLPLYRYTLSSCPSRRVTSAENIANLGEPTSRSLFRNGYRSYLRCSPAPARGPYGLERSCGTCKERPRVCYCRLCVYWGCAVRL